MAPEKVESVYLRVGLVGQVYLYGDSLKSACVALVVPDEEVLVAYAKAKDLPGNFQELCQNEVMYTL